MDHHKKRRTRAERHKSRSNEASSLKRLRSVTAAPPTVTTGHHVYDNHAAVLTQNRLTMRLGLFNQAKQSKTICRDGKHSPAVPKSHRNDYEDMSDFVTMRMTDRTTSRRVPGCKSTVTVPSTRRPTASEMSCSPPDAAFEDATEASPCSDTPDMSTVAPFLLSSINIKAWFPSHGDYFTDIRNRLTAAFQNSCSLANASNDYPPSTASSADNSFVQCGGVSSVTATRGQQQSQQQPSHVHHVTTAVSGSQTRSVCTAAGLASTERYNAERDRSKSEKPDERCREIRRNDDDRRLSDKENAVSSYTHFHATAHQTAPTGLDRNYEQINEFEKGNGADRMSRAVGSGCVDKARQLPGRDDVSAERTGKHREGIVGSERIVHIWDPKSEVVGLRGLQSNVRMAVRTSCEMNRSSCTVDRPEITTGYCAMHCQQTGQLEGSGDRVSEYAAVCGKGMEKYFCDRPDVRFVGRAPEQRTAWMSNGYDERQVRQDSSVDLCRRKVYVEDHSRETLLSQSMSKPVGAAVPRESIIKRGVRFCELDVEPSDDECSVGGTNVRGLGASRARVRPLLAGSETAGYQAEDNAHAGSCLAELFSVPGDNSEGSGMSWFSDTGPVFLDLPTNVETETRRNNEGSNLFHGEICRPSSIGQRERDFLDSIDGSQSSMDPAVCFMRPPIHSDRRPNSCDRPGVIRFVSHGATFTAPAVQRSQLVHALDSDGSPIWELNPAALLPLPDFAVGTSLVPTGSPSPDFRYYPRRAF